MSRFDERLLLGVVLLAALVSNSVLNAQPPAVQSPDTTAKPATTTITITSLPKAEPTPEQLGDALMAHQRYQAAIEAYKKGPTNDAAVWNKLGIAYQLMFNLTDAMHCYRTADKLSPKNSNILNNLGTVFDALKQFHDAERMYRKALKVDPNSAVIRKNLGTNLLSQHKYQKGWEEYKEALKIDPQIFNNSSHPRIENPASISERGAMNYYMAKGCLRAGMPERAIQYLRMALSEGFTNPKKISADIEFAGLRGVPEFEELLSSQTEKRQ